LLADGPLVLRASSILSDWRRPFQSIMISRLFWFDDSIICRAALPKHLFV